MGITPERLYEMWQRPTDPPWHRLPYYNCDAKREYGCFGKQHWEEQAKKGAV